MSLRHLLQGFVTPNMPIAFIHPPLQAAHKPSEGPVLSYWIGSKLPIEGLRNRLRARVGIFLEGFLTSCHPACEGETISALGRLRCRRNAEGFSTSLALPGECAAGNSSPASGWQGQEGCQRGADLSLQWGVALCRGKGHNNPWHGVIQRRWVYAGRIFLWKSRRLVEGSRKISSLTLLYPSQSALCKFL